MKKSIIKQVNESSVPSTLKVKENGRTFIAKDVVKIEEDFVSYPFSMERMVVRKDYKFWYADGKYNRFRAPIVTFN